MKSNAKILIKFPFLNAFSRGEKSRMQELFTEEQFYEMAGRRRAVVGKFNTANFFTLLYLRMEALQGPFSRCKLENLDAIEMGFGGTRLADIILRDNHGIHEIDVKAFNARSGHALCSVRQAGHFFSDLLSRACFQETPSLDYAIFRYGRRESVSWAAKTRSEMLAKLCEVNCCLSVPSNLLLALFSTSKRRRLNHQGANDGRQDYFYLDQGPIGNLVRSDYALGEIQKALPPELTNLRVEQLRRTHYYSPRIQINDASVLSFPVVKYSFRNLKEEKQWLARLRNDYKQIFRRLQIHLNYPDNGPPF